MGLLASRRCPALRRGDFIPEATYWASSGCRLLGGIVGQSSFQTDSRKLEEALTCMQAALALLDDTDVANDIGAHLDLAICRLTDQISRAAEIRMINNTPLPRI